MTAAEAFIVAATAIANDLIAKGATAKQATATATDYLLAKTIAERPSLAFKVYATANA